MKDRKKEITLLVIAILVIVSMIAGATYAFFKAQTGPAANFDINATTSTTDNLTFSTDGDIVLNVTAENLKKSGDDLSDTSIARARLIANNSSNSATAHYNVYLLIEENEMEYSSYTKEGQPNLIFMNKEKKEEANLEGYTGVPELILSVKKGETEQEITKRLTPTDGGYDITEAEGLYAIGENVEITSTSDVTDEWKVKVTFKNLEYNQQLNTGKSLKGKIIITAEKLLYEINDAAGLRKLSEEVNNGDTKEGKYYVLTNNIDLGEPQEGESNFIPIGTDANRFKGNFNGDNHTISNLYINNSTSDSIGLFGVIENSSINNLTLEGKIETQVYANTGGFVGTTYRNVLLNDIHNNVEITNNSNNLYTSSYIGGLAGFVNGEKLTIKSSTNLKNIDSDSKTIIGGLIGKIKDVNNVNIEYCYNEGNITNNILGTDNSGGLIGIIENSNVNINFSYNNGDVTGGARLGGLVASNNNPGKTILINKSYNKGNITSIEGDNTWGFVAGGIIGSNRHGSNVYIINAYNKGNIILKSNSNSSLASGILGEDEDGEVTSINANINIINSYNIGNIKSERPSAQGIIFTNKNNANDESISFLNINNVYNGGIISNFSEKYPCYGVGTFDKFKIITNVYYKEGIPGSNSEEFLTSLSENDMKIDDIYNKNGLLYILNENIKTIDINNLKNKLLIEKIIYNNYELTLSNWKLGDDGYPTLDF